MNIIIFIQKKNIFAFLVLVLESELKFFKKTGLRAALKEQNHFPVPHSLSNLKLPLFFRPETDKY